MRDDAIPFNPARHVRRLPLPEKKTAVLTPPQIAGIHELMEHWREDSGMSLRPNYRALIDGMDIMLGTSARVECIGPCRCDVDMTASPPTLLFKTATGLPMSVSNYERLLRSFVDHNRDALTAIGVDSDRHSTHIYRRTVATLVEQAAGITLASRPLGHAN